jgi:DNA-binding response OmpR family regulator
MLTAKNQPCDQKEGSEVGVWAYIVKPFSPLRLLETVQDVLAKAKTKSSG